MSLQLPFSRRLRALVRVFRLTEQSVWAGDFAGRFKDRAYALEEFERHNEEVKRSVPPERLLVYEVSEGWKPLCDFLEVEVPEGVPFPHLNDRRSFGRKDVDPVGLGWPQ